jgi:hypothetical protein
MNYGDLIKDAFWLTLRNRYLRFFGFFAGGTSAGGSFNVPSGGSVGSTMTTLTTSGSQVRVVSVAHQPPRRGSTLVNGYSITSL